MDVSVNSLRRMYLEFFESKGHLKMDSFSLIPKNDDSLLLINAGMAPLKPYFTGEEIPPRRRVTTCQKCVRTGDIENVGKTARHLTFFEMLGNFSFGDYFKEEAIHWSWEFLTEVLKMDPERLYVTIYENDDEAFRIWNEEIGVPAEKIMRIGRDENGKSDNFWEHGAGPCGPCTEIHYDRGEKYGTGPEDVLGGEGDRFMEVWNNVFTQFEGDGKGGYTELKQKNIDTGMGLERLAVIMQDVNSVFDIDSMKAIRDRVSSLSGKKYQENEKDDVSIRLITDHIRSATFMVSDGILPSNEGRGYVLRRLIRRAARHGRLLGIKDEFLPELSKTVIDGCSDGYPELEEKRDFILRVLSEEEQKFDATIDQGLSILSELEDDLRKSGKTVLSGEDAFRLYDTYGFPVDLTAEILEEKGFTYDEEGFTKCMEEQRNRARSARKVTNYMGKDATVYEKLDLKMTSEFDGYDRLSEESTVEALTTESEVVDYLTEGQTGTIITVATPFYGTMGGQCGDAGVIEGKSGTFKVNDTIHLQGGKIGHVGEMVSGTISMNDEVTLTVDAERRADIAANHSATHLLQAALRQVLGTHVTQAGSDVNPDRLRFDFTHFSAVTKDELKQIEDIVNAEIAKELPVVTDVMSLEEAKKTGAMALFGEKYGDKVRVVRMGDFSTELCGGTHVDNVARIRYFKIVSESGVASGVRRIEALTGRAAFEYFNGLEKEISDAAALLKTEPAKLLERIEHMLKEEKALKDENESLKAKAAKASLSSDNGSAEEIKGIKFISNKLSDVDMNGLRNLADDLKNKEKTAGTSAFVLFLSSVIDGKVNLVAVSSDEAVKRGIKAGDLIKTAAPKVGGGGGGRPDMAQAGGKNPAGVDEAIATAKEFITEKA